MPTAQPIPAAAPEIPPPQSTDPDVLAAAGRQEASRGRFDEAIAAFVRAVSLAPKRADLPCQLAALMLHRGRTGEAISVLERASANLPQSAAILSSLGVARKSAGDGEGAVEALERALALEPDNADVHFHLGGVLQDLGRPAEAIACFGRALELRPAWAVAWNRLGNFLQALARTAEARAAFERAAALEPAWSLPHHNLGQLAMARRDNPAAIAHLRAAVERDPQAGASHLDLGALLLTAGDFAAGWKHFEWRFGHGGRTPARPGSAAPVWDGSPLEGRTVMVWIEQGLGDQIQFARYAAAVAQRGGRVWLQAPRPLHRLFASLPGVDRLVAEGENATGFDLQIPSMSLARVLGTAVDSIPAPIPYLAPPAADAVAVRRLRAELAHGPELRVGIVWASGPGLAAGARRDCGAAPFARLAALPGVRLFSLQHGERARDLGEAALAGVVDLSSEVGDFARTAAWVGEMDLVITVDTALAHLAGALGAPVWTLLPEPADWRWLLERRDSPWYPTMRLFRQPAPGDWDAVFAAVEKELEALTAERGVR
jgi:tetratricopeptide (TPR) repeat protein